MKKTLLSLALAFAASTGVANAAPVYAQSIVSFDQNGAPVVPERSDPNAVKGPADGVFYSLGKGGNLVLDFGNGFVKAPGQISEITFRLEGYLEKVRIYVSETLDFTGAESIVVSNEQAGLPGGTSITFATAAFRYVKLVDIGPRNNGEFGRDGFDVDSISFSPVPVPAAGLMLAGAVAGLGALRRRAKKA